MSTLPPLPPLDIYIQWLAPVSTDAAKHYINVGVGVGWQRRCNTCQSLSELDNQGTFYFLFFFAVAVMVIE